MYCEHIDNETKQVFGLTSVQYEGYVEAGEIEQAYNGNWYVSGYAPTKPQETKEKEVRAVRAAYFEKYVDWYQSKPLLWEELAQVAKDLIAGYRFYLKDYTQQEGWYDQNPMTYEEWLRKTHPQSVETSNFYLNNL